MIITTPLFKVFAVLAFSCLVLGANGQSEVRTTSEQEVQQTVVAEQTDSVKKAVDTSEVRHTVKENTNAIPDSAIVITPDFNMFKDSEDFTEEMVSFYPNPAEDYLSVATKDMKKVEIIDMLGRIVIEKNHCNDSERIDVSALIEGLYFLRVTRNDNSAVVTKFVKK